MSVRELCKTPRVLLPLVIFVCASAASTSASAQEKINFKFDLAGFNSALDRLFCPASAAAPASPKVQVSFTQRENRCYYRTGDGPEQEISNNPYYRLVRAQFILEVASRYGAARISEYSETPEQDAIQLITALQDGRAKLESTRALVTHPEDIKSVRAPLERTDLAIALLKTANYATKSIKDLFSGWYSPKTWITQLVTNHGEDILKNLLKDRLYLSAYMESFGATIARLEADTSTADKTRQDLWKLSDDEILSQCKRLAKIADVEATKFCDASTS